MHSQPIGTPSRPTIYKGIAMRSRLEARWAAGLDELGLLWEYEPCAFASHDGQYLPDFRVGRPGYAPWYLEIRGPRITDPVPVQRRMAIIWASDPTARLLLLDDHDQWWFGADGDWRGEDSYKSLAS